MVKIDKERSYRDIEKVYRHEQYDGDPWSLYDIAVAKVTFPFTFGITALPACLPTNEYVHDYGGKLAVSIRIFVNDCPVDHR